ncbi:MAG: (2Fe-2S) ferredoxin domain-containing protein [Oscillospiraceae bacterium]|jgi:NADP-reducing hydrogenase subunit HndB|nr:(2Fe-2S) ferredoxin domain-containing protein [Oscillospiraceae bacterium]
MTTLAELNAAKDAALAKMTKTGGGQEITRVVVGLATCGIAAGATPVLKAFEEAAQAAELSNVRVLQTGCIGMCQFEPIAEITAPGQPKVTYVNMTAEKVKEVVEKHLKGGSVIEEYTVGAVTD